MSKVLQAAVYLLSKYSADGTLDKSKVTKVLFLADWQLVAHGGASLTGTNWRKVSCGPTSPELNEEAARGVYLRLLTSRDGDPDRPRLAVGTQAVSGGLSDIEKRIVDVMWEVCASRPWPLFLEIIGNTYPMVRTDLNEDFDLAECARLLRAEAAVTPGSISLGRASGVPAGR